MMIRLAILAVLVTLPFLILAFAYGSGDGAAWLMLPFFFMIPIWLLCVIVLAPVEWVLGRHAQFTDIILPLVCAAIAGLAPLVVGNPRMRGTWGRVLSGDMDAIGSVILLMLAGAYIGGAWRMTLRVMERFGWAL